MNVPNHTYLKFQKIQFQLFLAGQSFTLLGVIIGIWKNYLLLNEHTEKVHKDE